jgi:hypothetical protein
MVTFVWAQKDHLLTIHSSLERRSPVQCLWHHCTGHTAWIIQVSPDFKPYLLFLINLLCALFNVISHLHFVGLCTCYGLNMKYPWNFIYWRLDPQYLKKFRVRALGKCLDHEGSDLINIDWWIHKLMLLLEGGGKQEIGPSWRKWVTGGMPLKGILCPWSLSPFLSASCSPWSEQLCSTICFLPWFVSSPHMGPEAMEPSD